MAFTGSACIPYTYPGEPSVARFTTHIPFVIPAPLANDRVSNWNKTSTFSRFSLRHPIGWRVIRCASVDPHSEAMAAGARRDDTTGFTTTPSLYFPRGGIIRLRMAVDAGAHALTVKAKQPASEHPAPSARILANPSVGITADLLATAAKSSGWVTIGPLSFTTTAAGGIILELQAPWSAYSAECWFDDLILT